VVKVERDELLNSIIKGAEYIEKVGKNHQSYPAAMKKYNRLCSDLFKLDGRDADALP
jgi:hypothetical protein